MKKIVVVFFLVLSGCSGAPSLRSEIEKAYSNNRIEGVEDSGLMTYILDEYYSDDYSYLIGYSDNRVFNYQFTSSWSVLLQIEARDHVTFQSNGNNVSLYYSVIEGVKECLNNNATCSDDDLEVAEDFIEDLKDGIDVELNRIFGKKLADYRLR